MILKCGLISRGSQQSQVAGSFELSGVYKARNVLIC
jgi:hypothetical protein